MTYVEYLLSMDLRSRAEILQQPSAHQRITTVHEWVAVLGKTADALIEQASGTAPSEWSFYSQSMETAFGAAVESGLLSEREALIRRLNLSLALMVHEASIIGGDYLRDPRQVLPPQDSISITAPKSLRRNVKDGKRGVT